MTRRTLRPHLHKLEDRLTPAIATWVGGANSFWSTPQNWVGDIAPNPGDDLVFPSGAGQQVNVNDFPAGTTFHSLTVQDSGYKLSGNEIDMTSVTADFAFSIYLAAELDFVIGGSGGLTKAGDGFLVLGAANIYRGRTTVTAGALSALKGTGLGASGPDNGTLVAAGASLVLGDYGVIDSFPEDITFSSGRPDEPALNVSNDTLTGLLTLAGDGQISVAEGATATIARGISETGGSHNLALNVGTYYGGTLEFGTTSVNTFTGTTEIFGDAVFNGVGPTGPIDGGDFQRGAIVAGIGSIGPVDISIGSRLAPGGAISNPFTGQGDIGRLTTGNLTFQTGSQFVADLTPNGIDRVNVHGIVSIHALLTLAVDPAFVPVVGAHYRIIDNDGVDPVQGVFKRNTVTSDQLTEGAVITTANGLFQITYRGGDGNDVELIAVTAQSLRRFAVGAGAGGLPLVRVYDGAETLVRSFLAYDVSFHGGVRVATGDVDGDGVPDIVTGAGVGGGPHVKVFSGATGDIIEQFMAYDTSFRGGIFVAVADFGGMGHGNIITGAGAGGGPHVKVFDGSSAYVLFSFLAYDPSFTGGVSVAGFDAAFGTHATFTPGVIVTGAGPGGGPHVKAFEAINEGATPPLIGSFLAYDANFHGGVNVAADGSTVEQNLTSLYLVTSPASAGGPDVRIYNVAGQLVRSFFAYDAGFSGGVTVGMKSFGPLDKEIVTGAGPGGGPHVKVWSLTDNILTLRNSFLAFDPAFFSGIYVG